MLLVSKEADTLRKVREAAELGELDNSKSSMADEWHRRISERTNEQKKVYGLSAFFVVQCPANNCENYWNRIEAQA